MEAKTLNVEVRSEKGKNANRRLRSTGYIPGVIYSHGEVEQIQFKERDFFKLFRGHITESVIFDLNYVNNTDKTGIMAFVKDYQMDPASEDILHVDLFKVTKGEKIHTMVPVEIIGTAKGLKFGGMLEVYEREIEIQCLPRHLPEKFVVDVTELMVGQSIHAKDLNLGENLVLLGSPDAVIAAVHTIKVAKETEEAAAEPVAETGEKKAGE